MPRSALHGRLPRRLDSKAQFARSHHRGLVHRLRTLRAELPLRQYQFASVRSDDRRSGAGRPQKSCHQAKSDFVRSVHALERAQLCLCLPPRRRASRRPAHIFCRNARPGPRKMRMDKTQRGWALASPAILALSAFVYVLYAFEAPQGPRGGSVIGLAFGLIGFAFMIFAALLGARKRVPTWRVGRAQAWMRGHLWLGFLALPMIFFHGGFHFGGTLSRVLMWLLIITVLSGVFGAALQHYIPRAMTTDVPLETIYDEISRVRTLLREEADRAIESLCGDLRLSKSSSDAGKRAGGFTAVRTMSASAVPLRTSAAVSAGASAAVAAAPEIILLSDEEREPLHRFYLSEMRPFLERPKQRGQRLGDTAKASSAFAGLRTLLPAVVHVTLADLEDICGEARQLTRQERLHRWVHGWLLLHIPLSLALILLGFVHAVMALRY